MTARNAKKKKCGNTIKYMSGWNDKILKNNEIIVEVVMKYIAVNS